ncbi:uncharacterized protein LOC126784290 [Argentina anserina]|uniref:uncharacterized protein LOC126784290 n=1 Tax=Argentina anserina TaxID=57926 RepID=UPI00217685BD|nr:uncharacterized protein LOC126784290 [Potentilla anserina]
MAKKLGKASFLCDEELALILTKVLDPSDRKSFSQVCKQWLRVDGLNRSSIRFLRPDFLRLTLSRFPNLVVFETPNSISDTDLEFISQTCPKIEVLNLNLVTTSLDLGLKCLGLPALANGCPKLSKVILTGRSSITDQISVSLVNLVKNLTYLDLGCCLEVSDKSLEAIGFGSSISYLSLEWCCQITDKGLGFLVNGSCSKTLKTLILAWCERITDAGVVHLKEMQCLEHLNLANCGRKITDTGGVAISAISTLKKLSLVALVKVTDRTIVALAENCFNLEVIDLSDCRLTGAGIRAFASHKLLQSIVLRFCNISGDNLDNLVFRCGSLKSIVLDSETLNQMRPRLRKRTRKVVTMGLMA